MTTKRAITVYVPGDSSAVAVGADEVAAALADHVGVDIVRNGSRGMLWLEPLVELAPDPLREEVARCAADLVPAWRDWDVGESETGPAVFANLWDDTDQRNLRYMPAVRARHKLLSISQSVEITPQEKALLICASRLPNVTTQGDVM